SDGPLPPAALLAVARALAAALEAIHARGFVHRDLKPENVFVPGGPAPARVCDFGLVRAPGPGAEVTATGTVVGTPEYMAPEQLDGGDVDFAADLYAFGVM